MIQKKKIVMLILLIYFLPCRTENSTHRSRFSPSKNNNKRRFCSPIRLYANHCATFQLNISGRIAIHQLIISGDVELNPGPIIKPSCPVCDKTVRSNSKKLQCNTCKDYIHIKCSKLKTTVKQRTVQLQCHKCLLSNLPFFGCNTRSFCSFLGCNGQELKLEGVSPTNTFKAIKS